MAKSRKTRSTAAKPAPAPRSAAMLTPASEPAPEPKLVLRKKTFVERVMVEAGVKKGEARAMTDTVLNVLGKALSEGEEIDVPPLGKLKINRQFEKNGDEILVVKLKRKPGADAPSVADEKSDENPLADAGEGR
ncbi:HU family DNA-binding protein [Thioclava pacifica]|uniref:DNA-binding protein n=1 Tax=Thioclava pacifica DSM 10166 TaxID=1353537 RepID=A0A074J3K6_9RHOB|nr:HU family DNA-binding protein [Thioclava pacifica]KEO52036.1 hypothetical protein TP2_11215 [Thioclava pacifica DSM 10166]